MLKKIYMYQLPHAARVCMPVSLLDRFLDGLPGVQERQLSFPALLSKLNSVQICKSYGICKNRKRDVTSPV